VKNQPNSLAEQLFAKTGATLSPDSSNRADLLAQQEELAKQEEKNRLAQEQHSRVNPEDQTEIFAANAQKDQQEEEQLTHELRALAVQKQIPQSEQPKVLDAPVVTAGDRGTDANGLRTMAKQFIEKYIPSNWARAFQTKQHKKGPVGTGARTKMVHEEMHHEVNVNAGA
jgi:hypothetical protein